MPHATRTKEKERPVREGVPDDTEQTTVPAEDDSGSAPAAHRSGGQPAEAAAPSWTYPGPAPGAKRPQQAAQEQPELIRPRPIVPPSDTERKASTLSLGPVGRKRSPTAVAVLSAVTLGVYALIWHKRVNTEMADFDTRMHVRPGRSTLAVALPWLIGLLVTLGGAARIVVEVAHVTLPFDPRVTVFQAYFAAGAILVIPYLELVLSLSAVAIVMTLERVRVVEDRAGLTTDLQVKPAHDVWLLAVPIVGGLMLLSRVQRRLNIAWEQAMPSPIARISQY